MTGETMPVLQHPHHSMRMESKFDFNPVDIPQIWIFLHFCFIPIDLDTSHNRIASFGTSYGWLARFLALTFAISLLGTWHVGTQSQVESR
jgi:hypothetical protein